MGKIVETTATEKETEAATPTWTTLYSLRKGMKKEQSWWWKRKGFGRLCCMHEQDCDFAFMLNEHSCENCYFVSYWEIRVCIPIRTFSCYFSCKIVSILSLISKYEWFKNKNVTICGQQ